MLLSITLITIETGIKIESQFVIEELKQFTSWLDQFQLSKGSFTIYIIVVRKFLREAKELDEITFNKYLKHHPRSYVKTALKNYIDFKKLGFQLMKCRIPERKPIEIPKREEFKRILLKTVAPLTPFYQEDNTLYFIFNLLYFTGSRISEVLNIKYNDINFQENKLLLRIEKTHTFRTVELPLDFLKELEAYVNTKKDNGLLGEQRLFYTDSKTSHSAFMLLRRTLVKRLKDDKDINLLKHTHNFRRALINHIIETTDGNVKIAKEFIGHKAIATTELYITEQTNKELAKKGNIIAVS
jgi:integrase